MLDRSFDPRALKRCVRRFLWTVVHDLFDIALLCVLMYIGWHFAKRDRVLCQNCVTYPLKPRLNMVIYGDTPTHIDVPGSR